jgi:hypothetical protein
LKCASCGNSNASRTHSSCSVCLSVRLRHRVCKLSEAPSNPACQAETACWLHKINRMDSAKKVTFRSFSFPERIDVDELKQHGALITHALWGVNCCGLFILFISLCILGSKVPVSSIGLLWWSLFLHLGVSVVWSMRIFAPARCQCWSSELAALQPFEFMSAVLMMLLCDSAVQMSAESSVWT